MARQKVVLDPAVAAILGDGEKRERRRSRTKGQRARAERDGDREKVTWELSAGVKALVEEIAAREDLSPAGVVSVLAVDAVARYLDGELEFEEYRRPSRGPRYEWVADLNGTASGLLERLREIVGKSGGV
jgi:hypothetical protein